MLIASLMTALVASPDFEALDRAIARCDRSLINPAFAAEAERRSRFLTEAYRDQEQIVAERRAIAEQRRALRELPEDEAPAQDEPVVEISEEELSMRALLVEDRQRALNDSRLLESLRQEAMDAKRRFYLAHCASGRDRTAD